MTDRSDVQARRVWARPAWLLGGLVVLICFSYFRAALVPGAPWFSREPTGYYNLQAAGFLAGHLHAAIEPHPTLLALPDPYDPVANAPYRVHDMTLWNGKYYLYFGVAPILLLILPFRLLSGFYPAEFLVVPLFCSTGLVFATLALWEARRRFFPAARTWQVGLVVAALGVGSPVLLLNQAVQFYQVAISCAYALAMVGVWAFGRLWDPERRPWLWVLITSTSLGWCLAARPNYLLGVAFSLALGGALLVGRSRLPLREWLRQRWPMALALLGPVLAVGIGLLVYNALRFGSPFEFGMRYQLAGESFVEFTPLHWKYVLPHGFIYLFGDLQGQPYFPFIDRVPGAPFGVVRYLPLTWLLLPSLWLFWRKRRQWMSDAPMLWAGAILALGLGNLALVSAFFFQPMLRYQVDFAPFLLLAGGVGGLMLIQRLRFRRLASLALAGGSVIGIFVGASVFIASLPPAARSLEWSRRLNQPTAWLQKLRGQEHGALRLQVRLPEGKANQDEPILQSGHTADRRNWILVRFLSPSRASIVYFHAGLGELVSDPFRIPPDRRIQMEIRSGMLLPPETHPIYSGWDGAEVHAARSHISISVNEEVVLEAAVEAYPSRPADVEVGVLGLRGGTARQTFSGEIISQERLPLQKPSVPAEERPVPTSPIRLKLLLPAIPHGFDPLLATGTGRSSDLIYAAYSSSKDGPMVQFGFDHFGEGGPLSVPVAYDPTSVHELVVWMGNWGNSAGTGSGAQRGVLIFNGQVLLNLRQPYHPTAEQPMLLGVNRHGAGSAGTEFSGRLLGLEEYPAAELPPTPVAQLEAIQGKRGGKFTMQLGFPLSGVGRSEPLLVVGEPGAAEFVYVRYVDAHHVRFGFDRWGIGGAESRDLAVSYGRFYPVEIALGSLATPEASASAPGAVQIRFAGRLVLNHSAESSGSPAGPVYVARNPLGGSTTAEHFTGAIQEIDRRPVME